MVVSCSPPESSQDQSAQKEIESSHDTADSSSKREPLHSSSLVPKSIEQQKTPAPCELTLGWDPWEPYQYLTPDNQVKGLEIELIQSMAKQVNCSVAFKQGEWMNLLEDLKSGKIDMLGGASKTKPRELFAHFSEPYRHESFVLYLSTESMEDYAEKSIYELMEEKFRLGVTEDYIYGEAIGMIQDNKTYQSQIVTVPITEVNYYNLMQDNIDGFLEDPFVAGYTIKRKGLSSKIAASGIKVHSGDVSIMFSKASIKPELVEQFNIALETIKESGEYKKILATYSH